MAEFATESGVRLQVQIDDVSVASVSLIAATIAEAHERVLMGLANDVDTESPPTALIQGETLLSAGILLRALASRDAAAQIELQIGGQRIGAGQKFASLISMARRFEKEAEALLAPFASVVAMQCPGTVTPTTEVLGA